MFTLIQFYSLLFVGKSPMDTSGLSLKTILSRGKGVLSEILAKHIIACELPPKLLTFIEAADPIEEKNADNGADLLSDNTFNEFYSKQIKFF